MPVFISYKHEDKDHARWLADAFSRHRVPNYLDELDPSLNASNARALTSRLMKKVGECTHLGAVLSPKTRASWWVPFEIGVASSTERRISSMIAEAYPTSRAEDMPEYLRIWPIFLRREEHVQKFVDLYRKDNLVAKSRNLSESRPLQTPDDFHSAFSRSLGQR